MMMMLLDRTTTERKGRRSAPLLFRTFSLNPDNNTTFEKKNSTLTRSASPTARSSSPTTAPPS